MTVIPCSCDDCGAPLYDDAHHDHADDCPVMGTAFDSPAYWDAIERCGCDVKVCPGCCRYCRSQT